MPPYLLALTWTFAAYVVYTVIVRIVTARRHAAEAERRGCKPCKRMTTTLPFGLDRVKEAIKADNAMQFPELIVERQQNIGVTYSYTVLGTAGFVTTEPKNIQAILATQFQDFELGPLRRNNFFPLLGNGIFTSDRKGWEHSRTMMRPQFARDQVSDLKLEEEHVQNMMRAIPVDASGWTADVDLQVLFFRLTLDSACEFLFGESVGSQLAALPENAGLPARGGPQRDEKVFAREFDISQRYLARRSRLMKFYWAIDGSEFRRSCKLVHAFIDSFVKLALDKEQREKDVEKGRLSSKEKYVFLDALVAETRDPLELRSQLLNILLAGRDTTASLLGWFFYVLVRHQDIYSKLRTTILQDFGSYESGTELKYESLKNCQYLQHCLNELLRIYPVVPVNSRRVIKDTTLPTGGGADGLGKVFVAKGKQVDYSVHAMHRRTDLWGPDADEFRPERWVGRRPGWEYLPFNGGPRICLGQQFALTEASYVIVRLLQRFERMENLDPAPLKHNLTLTSCSGTGVQVRMLQAKQ